MLPNELDATHNYFTTILYVGDTGRGQALQASANEHGWDVLLPGEMLEALAMYVFFFPDLVILDAAANRDMAEAVFFHLRSVEAPELLVLADASGQGPWATVPPPEVAIMSPQVRMDELLEVVAGRGVRG